MSTDQEKRFTDIYVTHYADILGYLLRRARRVDAEDAASDVFTVVWRRLNDVPSGSGTLPGDDERSTVVVWTSADGITWTRAPRTKQSSTAHQWKA